LEINKGFSPVTNEAQFHGIHRRGVLWRYNKVGTNPLPSASPAEAGLACGGSTPAGQLWQVPRLGKECFEGINLQRRRRTPTALKKRTLNPDKTPAHF